MQDPLNILIDYLDSYQAGAQNKVYELPRKRKKSKKHSDGTAKKAKTYSSARRTLNTYSEEPIVAFTTPSVGTILSKFVPSETHCQSVDNNSSNPSTTTLSPTPNLNTFGFITTPCQTTSITTHVETAQSE